MVDVSMLDKMPTLFIVSVVLATTSKPVLVLGYNNYIDTTSSVHVSNVIDIDTNTNVSLITATTTATLKDFDFFSSLTNAGIVTIPLLPYHIVQRRRRRRNLLTPALDYQKQKYDSTSNEYSKYRQNRRRSRQRLRYRDLVSNKNTSSNTNDLFYNAQSVASLYQGWGTHYVDVWCGTPPQRQTLIVDTGSSVTAFPCSSCSDCGVPDYHIDQLYNEKHSSTFHKLSCNECLRGYCSKNTCGLHQSYAEGSSWTAYEASDTCYVGGFHNTALVDPVPDSVASDTDDLNPSNANLFAFGLKFGCQTKLTGLFIQQLADGIMGMDIAKESFWYQMYQAKKIQSQSFSLCFNRKDGNIDPQSTTEAGAMSLGGTDVRLHSSPMVYTESIHNSEQHSKHKIIPGSNYYVVTIRNVYLRGPGAGTSALANNDTIPYITVDISQTDIGKGTARVIVDSGTTDTYFPTTFGIPFTQAWTTLTGTKYSTNPISMTASELDERMPTILIQLRGSPELNKIVQDQYSSSKQNDPGIVPGLAGSLDPTNPYDVIVAIPPSHYYEYAGDGTYESRFFVDGQSRNGVVLGANTIMGHDVYFDIERNRIGWAESLCDYTKLVSSYNIDLMDGKTVPETKNIEDTKSSHSASTTNKNIVQAVPTDSPKTSNAHDKDMPDESKSKESNTESAHSQAESDDKAQANLEKEQASLPTDSKEFITVNENDGPDDDNEYDSDVKESSASIVPDGFCNGIACHAILILALISFVVVGIVVRVLRRPHYQQIHQQLDIPTDGIELKLTEQQQQQQQLTAL